MKKLITDPKLKYPLIFGFSLLVIALSYFFRTELLSLGRWGLVGIFLINILASATVFIPAPGIATVFSGGIVYNPLLVAIVAGLGSAIGDMVAYYLGKSGKEIFLKKDSMKYTIARDVFGTYGPFFIIIFSFIPNPIFDAVGIVAGAFHYPAKKFFVFTLIGRFLRNLVIASAGSFF